MPIHKPFSAVILSAGESSRMGRPKALLKFTEAKTFLERIIDVYNEAGAESIVIVCSSVLKNSVIKIISGMMNQNAISIKVNSGTESSRFSSIKSGIETVPDGHYVFIQNIDNPFTEPNTILELRDSALANCYTVPVINGRRAHPIILSAEIVRAIAASRSSDTDFRKFISAFHRIEVPMMTTELTANINTPADYGIWFDQEL